MTLHILALETSSSLCGVALLSEKQGEVCVQSAGHDATAEHAERLLPMIDEVLARAGVQRNQLSTVAYGQGPGGFTGLRVACGVTQGMAFALDLPVIPVPSLLAVADQDHAARGDSPTVIRVVVQDARMGEVYLAAYGPEGLHEWRVLQPPVLLTVEDVGTWLDQAYRSAGHPSGGIRLLGDALAEYPALVLLEQQRVWLSVGPALRASAEGVARLALRDWHAGRVVSPDLAAPLYVRDKVAFTTAERQEGAGGNPRAPALVQVDAAHSIGQAVIERMGHNDLNAVADIERSVQSFPWSRGNFADGLEAGYSGWVARQGGAVVGFYMAMHAPDVAHVLVVAVRPDCQRHGIGHMLLEHCEQRARESGLPALLLEVRPSNGNAITIYESLGFQVIATRKAYYPAGRGEREDGLVMQKNLVLQTPADANDKPLTMLQSGVSGQSEAKH
ncbi:tRNA (adenosine(37)-N6)-threonylcarbamoyltransferase complex dimerization subunit type 1 TsaB [Allopusillimonas ginsengisoli]|uniref:tRNA (adenosine(37)-N6)-threonylcarbamoyltransferase complex dimerization subunit type 1 TsaB n=1 Tax=Allopusillimonas ginsengisoli TaxID=453575 RepID=UPI0010C1D33A|nr:tRNA (adenosine(37)-N6)-threonylcarbamoyltransferase complex dimerization subunit type 1 TsaB [Allopusillimonas ginsengisoli]